MLKIELLKHIRNRRRQVIYWFSYFVIASVLLFIYCRDGQHQNFIYPSMRLWRRLTLPLIQRFPRLTEFYDETCLMGNPFFQIEDLNCEPCAYVDSVIEIPDSDEEGCANGSESGSSSSCSSSSKLLTDHVPFVFKRNQSSIKMEDFFRIYNKNEEVFRRDAFRVQSTNRYINNLEDLFYQVNNSNDYYAKMQTHSLWRCNRMLPARLLRPLFSSSSSRLPTRGIALERYVSFDTSNASTYYIPDTECKNVYVQQLLGSRFIILRPTTECRHLCRTLSLRLPQSFVLSYNWLYWKPISAPDPVAESSSITLIGSYC